VPSYAAGITVPNHALITVSDALRHRRAVLGTRWRLLSAGQQAGPGQGGWAAPTPL